MLPPQLGRALQSSLPTAASGRGGSAGRCGSGGRGGRGAVETTVAVSVHAPDAPRRCDPAGPGGVVGRSQGGLKWSGLATFTFRNSLFYRV